MALWLHFVSAFGAGFGAFGTIMAIFWLLVLGEFWPLIGLVLDTFWLDFGDLGLFWGSYGCILEGHN